MKTGILGFGVVGSGVAELLVQNGTSIAKKANEPIECKKILEIRKLADSAFSGLLTANPDEIFGDPEIEIVVETIGGVKHAYEYTKRAFESGKHVVTSNKELVSKHGPELLEIAKRNSVNYLFEASVGGGIPIIRPLEQCLAANEISMVAGILNGTTNYILTKMGKEGLDFSIALREAQEKGYAEANPGADIDGHDTRRKIAILSSIAYGKFVDSDRIPTEGISRIDKYDIDYANQLNAKIKLVGMSRLENGHVHAEVAPMLIYQGEYLSTVDDVFNAILVKGDAIGEAMFYGRGAGKFPTASAVIADIIYITKNRKAHGRYDWKESLEVDGDDSERRYFLRIHGSDHDKAEALCQGIVTHGVAENEYGFTTEPISPYRLAELEAKLDIIKKIKYI